MARFIGLELPFQLTTLAECPNNTLSQLQLYISQPKKSSQGYQYCFVEIPYFFKKPKRIVGVSEEQAIELSFKFVETILASKEIILFDDEGNKLSLPYWKT